MCNPITTKNPESLLAKGEHLGFEWEVTNNGIGYRCGYVRLPLGHPWHGKHYDDLPVEVHGGLTFSEADADCNKGGEDNAFWIGFDCAHCMDAPDPILDPYRRMPDVTSFGEGVVRSTEYVQAECEDVCRQAAEAMEGSK